MEREESYPIVFGARSVENKITRYEYILTGGSVLKMNVEKALWGSTLVFSVRVVHCPGTKVIFMTAPAVHAAWSFLREEFSYQHSDTS